MNNKLKSAAIGGLITAIFFGHSLHQHLLLPVGNSRRRRSGLLLREMVEHSRFDGRWSNHWRPVRLGGWSDLSNYRPANDTAVWSCADRRCSKTDRSAGTLKWHSPRNRRHAGCGRYSCSLFHYWRAHRSGHIRETQRRQRASSSPGLHRRRRRLWLRVMREQLI